MRLTAPTLFLLFAACAGGSAPPPTAEPAPPPRVQYVPSAARYAAVSHRRVEQEISGRSTATTIVSRYVLQTEIAPASDGMPVVMVLDSLAIEGQAGIGQDEIARAEDTRFTARLLPTGALRDFAGGDTSLTLVRQIASTLRDFFPRVPPDGAQPGDRWVDTTESVTDVGGVVITMRAIGTHEVLDWDEYGGSRALPIRVAAQYILAGSGMQAGQDLVLEGTGSRHERQFLSADGVYLGSIGADTSRFEVRLTQMGMTIPGRQWSADTVAVLR